ncbi:MAG: RagB/SusD family nutrient uptake outer membrane protein, partial [Sphingobacteriales bacterium]
DDYFLLPAAYASSAAVSQLFYQWKPLEIRYGNDWHLGYLAIYNANLSLDLLPKVERTSSNGVEWDNIQGSALFYRAYYVAGLCGIYAKVYNEQTAGSDLGVVLRASSDFNVPSVRSTLKDCFAQIIQDASRSLELLPKFPQHSMRPSKGAACALLARTYLYMGNYELARKWADEAIKINPVLMDYNGDAFITNLSGAMPFKRFNPETIFYTEMGLYNVLNTTGRSRIDTNLVATFDPSDLRRKAYFLDVAGYQQFKGGYAENAFVYFSGLATDEQYLIRAEANAVLGQTAAAIEDVNFLLRKRWDRTKPFIPVTAGSKAEAIAKVRLERRKEMVMRGVRWTDIKRYNREGEQIVLTRKIGNQIITLPPDAPYYAVPIPADIIERTGMPQN